MSFWYADCSHTGSSWPLGMGHSLSGRAVHGYGLCLRGSEGAFTGARLRSVPEPVGLGLCLLSSGIGIGVRISIWLY